MSPPSCKGRAQDVNENYQVLVLSRTTVRCTATDRVHAYAVYRKPYATQTKLNVLKKIVFPDLLTCSAVDGQDGTEWAETGLTGNEKIEDTVQCVSLNSRPGHATIQVNDGRSLLCGREPIYLEVAVDSRNDLIFKSLSSRTDLFWKFLCIREPTYSEVSQLSFKGWYVKTSAGLVNLS